MLYIYLALFLSSILCLTGIVLSFINLQKYNFGLYLILLAIVAFTIALAFYVVKPKACLGPQWFIKLMSQPSTNFFINRNYGRGHLLTDRNINLSSNNHHHTENGNGNRRLMFFGFNTAAFFRSDLENGHQNAANTIDRSNSTNNKKLDLYRIESKKGDFESNLIEEAPPSTQLIPPTPPSFVRSDEDDDSEDECEIIKNIDIHDHDDTRVRAWTFTSCATTANNEKKQQDSIECWRQWQQFLLQDHSPNLLLKASFPLSERAMFYCPTTKKNNDSSTTNSNSQSKSWSTEEVVNLNEFLNSPSSKPKSHSSENFENTNGNELSEQQLESPVYEKPPLRKNALIDDPHSWKRAHTITVKYVPVKTEWISKPLTAVLENGSGGFYRKKSKSSNAVFTLINETPRWSLANLFQRSPTNSNHQNNNSRQQMV